MPTVTLKDVAAKAGVSYQTVSKVLNRKAQVAPETEARIWRAVRELNYRPNVAARNLRTQASHLLGYAWRHVCTSWRPILNSFLYSVIDAAEARGYLTVFFTDHNTNQSGQTVPGVNPSYAELYARKQVDGFILADIVQNDPRVVFLLQEKIPFASFGRTNEDWDHCWVDVDGIAGIEAVVAHLREREHKRIAFIGLGDNSQTAHHRCEGYLRGLRNAEIDPDPEWIVAGQNTTQTGAEGVARLLSLPAQRRPSAVVCATDQIAVGAMNAAHEAGLQVGWDIAITGYDDMPTAAHLQPSLTTVRQPVHQVGQHIVDLVLKQINGEPIEQKGILLKPELVVRKSS